MFPGGMGILLEEILLITNLTSNTIIFNFADPTLTGTVSENVLTLNYNTTAMNSTDKLQIWYDILVDNSNIKIVKSLRELLSVNKEMRTALLLMLNLLGSGNFSLNDLQGDN
jgi:hypothetical protein